MPNTHKSSPTAQHIQTISWNKLTSALTFRGLTTFEPKYDGMGFADDDIDAVLFRKIKSGKYDADDPVWDSISAAAKDLIVSALLQTDHRVLILRRIGVDRTQ